jgi:hypothetical protein
MSCAERGRGYLIGFMCALGVLCMPFVTHANLNTDVEAEVRSYFSQSPAMIEIARCESRFRQFGNNGNVLRGGISGGMVGVFQIYESIHRTQAQSLGFDIETLEGNMGYAQYLYDASGTSPWNSARSCWGHAVAQSIAVETDIEALQKKIVALSKLVTQLQQLLAQRNASGV